MASVDDKVYRLLADLAIPDLCKLLDSSVGFQVKLQEYSDEPVSLAPDSEEEAEGNTDGELILTEAAGKWRRLQPEVRDRLLKLADGAGANAGECRETLELWGGVAG